MTCSTVNQHTSGSGGNLRESSQKVRWLESLARWFTGRLPRLDLPMQLLVVV